MTSISSIASRTIDAGAEQDVTGDLLLKLKLFHLNYLNISTFDTQMRFMNAIHELRMDGECQRVFVASDQG